MTAFLALLRARNLSIRAIERELSPKGAFHPPIRDEPESDNARIHREPDRRSNQGDRSCHEVDDQRGDTFDVSPKGLGEGGHLPRHADQGAERTK